MKSKFPAAKSAQELGRLLALSPEDAIEMELRSSLNAKIIEVVNKRKLTHVEVAKLCAVPRTRITALLNGNTKHISTSAMIRILAAMGIRTSVTYSLMRLAA